MGLTIIRLDRTPKTLLPTTEPQLHAGFAVAGALTAEWLVQKEQSLPKDVDALVAERLNTVTIVANPFAGMSVGPRVNAKALAKDAPAMMVACGLAMRSAG